MTRSLMLALLVVFAAAACGQKGPLQLAAPPAPEAPAEDETGSNAVGDLEVRWERHRELDEVKRVSVKVVNERGLGCHLLLVDTQLLNDDLLEALIGRISQGCSLLCGGLLRPRCLCRRPAYPAHGPSPPWRLARAHR
jgi:predicted small lipoprotein YifL